MPRNEQRANFFRDLPPQKKESKPDRNSKETITFQHHQKAFEQFIKVANSVFAFSQKQLDLLKVFKSNQLSANVWDELTASFGDPVFLEMFRRVYSSETNFFYFFDSSDAISNIFLPIISTVQKGIDLEQNILQQAKLSTEFSADLKNIFEQILISLTQPKTKIVLLHLLTFAVQDRSTLEMLVTDYQTSGMNPARFSVWRSVFVDGESISALKDHPDRAQFHSVPVKQRVRTVFTKFSEYTEDRIPFSFWMDHPSLFQLVTKLLDIYPDPSTNSWGEKRLVFQLLIGTLGRHGVTDTELVEQIFALWQPSFQEDLKRNALTIRSVESFYESYQDLSEDDASDLPNERKTRAFTSLSAGDQRELLDVRYNEITHKQGRHYQLSEPLLQYLRQRIRQEKGISEKVSARDLKEEAELTNWLEGNRHPLARWLRLAGNEIEANIPREMLVRKHAKSLFTLIGFFCYRNGFADPIEISADPCVRPETAQAILDDLVNSGLLDLHAENTQSLHFNLEVYSAVSMSFMLRFHYLCGRGCRPVRDSTPKKYEQQKLLVFEKKSHPEKEDKMNVPFGRINYCEGKGLRVNTIAETKEMMRITMLIGSAVSAYEKILQFSRSLSIETLRVTLVQEGYSALTRSEIEAYPDPVMQSLALVWLDFVTECHELTKQVFDPKEVYWAQTINGMVSAQLGRMILDIFPRAVDHDDLARLQITPENTETVIYHNRVYPNVLLAARDLGEDCVQSVLGIFAQQLAEIREVIQAIEESSGESQEELMLQKKILLSQITSTLSLDEDLSDAEILALYDELKFRMVDDPNLANGDYNLPL